MYHKSLNVLIQCHPSEFLLINDFNLTGGLKGFFGDISFLGELFFSKLYVSITKAKKGHS